MGSHECPICELKCKSEQGLNQHYFSQHNKRYLNRTCGHCGRKFRSTYEKKYCSEECLREAGPYEGAANPNYRGGKRTAECERCGREFEYYPSDKEGRFCAECVRRGDWQSPPQLSGPDNPRWNGGKQRTECDVCGREIERYPSNMTGEASLCSESCRRKWLSKAFTGPGHPNWKGGGNEPYGSGWSAVRKAALERDGYRCVVCGTSREELGRNPDVHHIVPVRRFVDIDGLEKTDAHDLHNVVSLCVECHRRADFGRITTGRLRELIDSTG